mgnify:CR=1 FL=1
MPFPVGTPDQRPVSETRERSIVLHGLLSLIGTTGGKFVAGAVMLTAVAGTTDAVDVVGLIENVADTARNIRVVEAPTGSDSDGDLGGTNHVGGTTTVLPGQPGFGFDLPSDVTTSLGVGAHSGTGTVSSVADTPALKVPGTSQPTVIPPSTVAPNAFTPTTPAPSSTVPGNVPSSTVPPSTVPPTTPVPSSTVPPTTPGPSSTVPPTTPGPSSTVPSSTVPPPAVPEPPGGGSGSA